MQRICRRSIFRSRAPQSPALRMEIEHHMPQILSKGWIAISILSVRFELLQHHHEYLLSNRSAIHDFTCHKNFVANFLVKQTSLANGFQLTMSHRVSTASQQCINFHISRPTFLISKPHYQRYKVESILVHVQAEFAKQDQHNVM